MTNTNNSHHFSSRAQRASIGIISRFFDSPDLVQSQPDRYHHARQLTTLILTVAFIMTIHTAYNLLLHYQWIQCLLIMTLHLLLILMILYERGRYGNTIHHKVMIGNLCSYMMLLSCISSMINDGGYGSSTLGLVSILPIIMAVLTGSQSSVTVMFINCITVRIIIATLHCYQYQFPDQMVIFTSNTTIISLIINGLIEHLVSFAISTAFISLLKRERKLFNDLISQAKRALLNQNMFIAKATHELRTPLTQIIGLGEMLGLTALDTNQMEMVSMLKSSAEGVCALVSDLLEFEKLETENIKLEKVEVNLREIIRSTMKLTAIKAHAKGINLCAYIDEEVPAVIIGDSLRIRQILQNLLSNSVKFIGPTVANGAIIIRQDVIRHDQVKMPMNKMSQVGPTTITIRTVVEDNGMGMTSDVVDRVFKEFDQGSGHIARLYGGSGLGLSISKGLANKMGGDVQAYSPGTDLGSTFTFTMNVLVGSETHDLDLIHSSRTANDIGSNDEIVIISDSPSMTEWIRTACCQLHIPCRTMSWNMIPSHHLFNNCILIIVDIHVNVMNTNKTMKLLEDQLPVHVKMLALVGSIADVVVDRPGTYVVAKPMLMHEIQVQIQKALGYDVGTILGIPSIGGSARTSISIPDLSGQIPLHVLLVDDNQINRKVLGRMLTQLGHTFEEAHDGSIALSLLIKMEKMYHRFDVILTDLHMPIMDGLQLAHHIRLLDQQAGGSVYRRPIFLLSAGITQNSASNGNIDIDIYLEKPITLRRLYQSLQNVKKYPNMEETTVMMEPLTSSTIQS